MIDELEHTRKLLAYSERSEVNPVTAKTRRWTENNLESIGRRVGAIRDAMTKAEALALEEADQSTVPAMLLALREALPAVNQTLVAKG